jgi:uncharacterized zinc-type alcohol dehydrogenase-like protein
MVGTYNARDYDGELMFGGYSNNIVADARYVHSISPKLNLAAVAPLLCAGITTYSPLKFWKAGRGKKVGIVGLGGLGHMGLKFAHSMGAETVLFTTSAGKVADGQKLGADEVVVTKDSAAVAKHAGSFDFILDCVSAPHDVNQYVDLLRLNGTMCLVGLPETAPSISPFSIITNRRSFSGSMIGGMPQTQEMLDYCAEHGIVSEIEMTSVDKLGEAYERVVKGDVKYRFVIDMGTLPKG